MDGRFGQQPRFEDCCTYCSFTNRDTADAFQIVKRALQLTGSRLPDPLIGSATTLADLYQGYVTEEPAKKLYDSKEIQRLKANVPNVIVHEKRQTMMEKEKAIGRWKLIEDELVARDLPLTGLRWPRTAKSDYR